MNATNEPRLDVARLENVRTQGNRTIAACPACRAAGRDRAGDNLVIFEDENFACAAYQGDREHRVEILQLAGIRRAQTEPWQRPMQRSQPSRKDADKLAERAAKRDRWPALRAPTAEEIARVAELRRLPVRAVIAAAKLGLLRCATFSGHECFVIGENKFQQGRRLDGGMMPTTSGPKKVKDFPGREGAFIGLRHLGDASVRVLLVEGVIGIIEALALLELTDPAENWTALAAVSASSKFEDDPAALAALSGRAVTIIHDNGSAGEEAAECWFGELTDAGCRVQVIAPPPQFKDLGDHIGADPDPETLAQYIA